MSSTSHKAGSCNACTSCDQFFPHRSDPLICADDNCSHPFRMHAKLVPGLTTSNPNPGLSTSSQSALSYRQQRGNTSSTDTDVEVISAKIVTTSSQSTKSRSISSNLDHNRLRSSATPARTGLNLSEVRTQLQHSRSRTPSTKNADTRAGRKTVNDMHYQATQRRRLTHNPSPTSGPSKRQEDESFEISIRLFTCERGCDPAYLPSEQKFYWDGSKIITDYDSWLSRIYTCHVAWIERAKHIALDEEPLSDSEGQRQTRLAAIIRVSTVPPI